jgi:hypothetical protein
MQEILDYCALTEDESRLIVSCPYSFMAYYLSFNRKALIDDPNFRQYSEIHLRIRELTIDIISLKIEYKIKSFPYKEILDYCILTEDCAFMERGITLVISCPNPEIADFLGDYSRLLANSVIGYSLIFLQVRDVRVHSIPVPLR